MTITLGTNSIFIPLEQGLRRLGAIVPVVANTNSIFIPLEQGLRPDSLAKSAGIENSIFIPLEQGLRPTGVFMFGVEGEFYLHSIRTRIKTCVPKREWSYRLILSSFH